MTILRIEGGSGTKSVSKSITPEAIILTSISRAKHPEKEVTVEQFQNEVDSNPFLAEVVIAKDLMKRKRLAQLSQPQVKQFRVR